MCLTGTWTVERDVMNLKFVGIRGIFIQVGPGCITKFCRSGHEH